MEKNAFFPSVTADYEPEAMLICSSEDITSGLAAAVGASA